MSDVDRPFLTEPVSSAVPMVYMLCGPAAAFICWALFEPFFQEGGSPEAIGLANIFIFPAVVGTISAVLCAVHGMTRRQGGRVFAPAAAGFGVAFACAFLVLIPIQVIFDRFEPLMRTGIGPYQGSIVLVMLGRSLAWGLTASCVGPGVYAGTRNPPFLVAGISGGLVGGLMAGFLFDPIQSICSSPAGECGWISRLTGFIVAGGMASLCMGIAGDLSARRSLLITSGPKAGTRFTIDSGPCVIECMAGNIFMTGRVSGSLPCAVIQKNGFAYEFICVPGEPPCLVNGRPMRRTYLRQGDRITIDGVGLLFADPGSAD